MMQLKWKKNREFIQFFFILIMKFVTFLNLVQSLAAFIRKINKLNQKLNAIKKI